MKLPRGVGLSHGQVVGVQIHTDGRPSRLSVTTGTSITLGGEQTPASPFIVPLEPVADGLAQIGGPRCFLTMLSSIAGVLGIALQALPATCSWP